MRAKRVNMIGFSLDGGTAICADFGRTRRRDVCSVNPDVSCIGHDEGLASLSSARRTTSSRRGAPEHRGARAPCPVAIAAKLRHRSASVVFRSVKVIAMRQSIGTLAPVLILSAVLALAPSVDVWLDR